MYIDAYLTYKVQPKKHSCMHARKTGRLGSQVSSTQLGRPAKYDGDGGGCLRLYKKYVNKERKREMG